ncbi:MAG: hypothetical protein GX263_09620 [Firmicutes bacterium]|nr:hypothetical protein [Bacillota bacterium]
MKNQVRRIRWRGLFLLLALAPFALILFSLGIGRYPLPLSVIAEVLWSRLWGLAGGHNRLIW